MTEAEEARRELSNLFDAWDAFLEATTPVAQADAVLTFANAVHHYRHTAARTEALDRVWEGLPATLVTPFMVESWLAHPEVELGGRTPSEALDDGDFDLVVQVAGNWAGQLGPDPGPMTALALAAQLEEMADELEARNTPEHVRFDRAMADLRTVVARLRTRRGGA